jgi:hypothetical protein
MANKECKSLNLLGFHGSLFTAYTATTAPVKYDNISLFNLLVTSFSH